MPSIEISAAASDLLGTDQGTASLRLSFNKAVRLTHIAFKHTSSGSQDMAARIWVDGGEGSTAGALLASGPTTAINTTNQTFTDLPFTTPFNIAAGTIYQIGGWKSSSSRSAFGYSSATDAVATFTAGDVTVTHHDADIYYRLSADAPPNVQFSNNRLAMRLTFDLGGNPIVMVI